MRIRKSIKGGIEIEAIYNRRLLPLGSRDRKLLKGWRIKGDGSLRSMGEFDRCNCIEFVSDVSVGRNRFKKRLEDFRDAIIVRSEEKDLKKVLAFNVSCGCHIHLGLTYSNYIGNFLSVELVREFRKDFFKGLLKLDVSKRLKDNIKNHYFRKYAKKTSLRNFKGYSNQRYVEINRLSEFQMKGLEWRSFNILGCDNWEDFIKVIMYGYDCFESLVKKRINGYVDRRQVFKVKNEIVGKEIKEVVEIPIEMEKEIIENV